jgi:hypothetical protein
MKPESLKERMVRVESQREQDVETNALEHKSILDGIGGVRTLLDNHLAHTDRWLWVLASGLVMAIIPYAVYAIIEIIKHVLVAKAAVGT